MRDLVVAAGLGVVILAAGYYCRWKDPEENPEVARIRAMPAEYDGREVWVPNGVWSADGLVVSEQRIGLSGMPAEIPEGSSVTVRGTFDAATGAIRVIEAHMLEPSPYRGKVDYAVSGLVVVWLLWRLTRLFRLTVGPGRMIVRRG